MKKLIFWLLLALACNEIATAQSYIPTITSSGCIGNGAGDVLSSGKLIIVGTNEKDQPIPYRVNGSAQAITSPITRTVTNGAIVGSLQLANPANTSPVGVLFRIAIQDNITNKITVYKQIIVSANSGSNFDLCLMNTGPSFAPVTVITNPGTINGNTIQNGDFTVNDRFITTPLTVTFSATPTFDCSLGSYFKITLTGNVTSSTLSSCSSGQRILFDICQDGTGSRTFAWPANVQNPATVPPNASQCSVQYFAFDGGASKALPIIPFLTGDITQTGSTLSVIKVDGVSYPASPSVHQVPVITASGTATYKTIPDCTSSGNKIQYQQSGDTFTCVTTASSNFQWGCTGTSTASSTIVMAGGGTCTNTAQINYPVSSTITVQNLRCAAATAGVNASSGVVTLKKGGSGTAITCTFGTGNSCTDLTHTVATSSGDILTLQFTTQAAETLANIGCLLEARQ